MYRFCIYLIIGLAGFATAQTTPPPPTAAGKPWILKTYTFPNELLASGFDTKDQGRLAVPKFPGAGVSEEQMLAYLKRTNQILGAYFSAIGYAPPVGSLLEYDPDSFTLVARTTENFHVLLSVMAEQALRRQTRIVSGSLEIIEAEAGAIREELKTAATSSNHEPILTRLSALADGGKARHIADLHIETRSGQRVRVSTNDEREHGKNFELKQDGSTNSSTGRREVGTSIELDPVLGEDGYMIDVNFAINHDFAAPTERWAPSSARLQTKRVESRLTDFHNAKVNSALSMIDGSVKLLGVWKPEGTAEVDKANVLQAAFLRMDARHVLPLENPTLLKLVITNGEKVVPTPDALPPLPEGVPAGMIIKLMHVTQEMFGIERPAAPADPFAAPPAGGLGAAPPSEPKFATRSTVLDILRAAGVDFPKGSSATYDEENEILLIRNTPENIEKVLPALSQLTNSRQANHYTKFTSTTAHIVQADGSLIRKIQAEMRRLADHTNGWNQFEEAVAKNQATIQRSIWLETRSGQRSKAEAGHDFATSPTEFERDETAIELASSAAPVAKPDAPAPAPASESPPSPPVPASKLTGSISPTLFQRFISGETESTRLGTIFEIDTIIGEDGHTIDLNLALDYDFAMPTQRPGPEAAPDSVLRTEASGTDFHRAKLNLATTMNAGTWRLIGVWKPRGTAEFDGKDILQALFVRTDVNAVIPPK